MSRVDTVNYLKGESACYCGIVQETKDSDGIPIVMGGTSEYFKLMEDCMKDVYEQLQKMKDKMKKLEAKIVVLESHDDNSTLIG